MFKNDFQGGNYFEVFNPTVKDPLNNFKLTGSHGIQKIFDKEVKGSVYQLDGAPTTTKITIPKDSKQGLSLVQRIIVFQVNVKTGHEFSLDLGITDLSQNRRNLLFSTSHKELSIQPLSARVPIKSIERSMWINFVLDLPTVINEIWKNQTFKSIDSLTVCANCRLRKIFTLKNPPLQGYGLSVEDTLAQVDFPPGTESKIHIFSLNDQKSNEIENSLENPIINGKQKNNVFKIAFGTKIVPPINSTQVNQTKKPQSAKLSNSQPLTPGSVNSDALSLSFKNTQIAPLSMSNGDMYPELSTNRKSISEHNLNDKSPKSSFDASNTNRKSQEEKSKPTWNRANKTKPLQKSESQNQLIRKSIENKPAQTSNKIPHPPPQSTRPTTTSSVRKLRLPSSIKTNQINKTVTYTESVSNEEEPGTTEITTISLLNNQSYNKTKYSDNILNESINDLIQVLKSSAKYTGSIGNSKSGIQTEKFSEITNLDDSGKTIVYSFSSKPKPVSLITSPPPPQAQNSIDKTSNQQFYDYRKYSSNQNLLSLVKDSLNDDDDEMENKDLNVMDSFEARMLQEMKAEMENNKIEKNKNSNLSKQTLENKNEINNFIDDVKSPDIGYFEAFQRGRSDLRSPLSDDNNHTTSEKYNFDAMTSSIDETTTSLSKKAVHKTKGEDTNNYQDEMNISILSSLPAKSINFKDIPSKYSPLLSQLNQNKIQKDPITEEPAQYDDSQADIDEIISDSDEEIDLLYDQTLNCYYDPKTCTYYELNLS